MQPFNGLTANDFDAFLAKKWSSNAFNRERLQVREKLEALAHTLSPNLLRDDGAHLRIGFSTDHPAIWNQHKVKDLTAFFTCTQDEVPGVESLIAKQRTMASLIGDPSPLRNHAFLAITIDHERATLATRLHRDAAIDRDNFHHKCEDFFRRERVLADLHALPDGFLLGIASDPLIEPKASTDATLQSWTQQLGVADTWFVVEQSWPRADVVTMAATFFDLCKERLLHLLPIFQHLAWSRTNDFLNVRETLREHEAKSRAKGVEKNDRVRIVRGLFAGKVGTVQDIDSKGLLKVHIGSVAVKLSVSDVIAL